MDRLTSEYMANIARTHIRNAKSKGEKPEKTIEIYLRLYEYELLDLTPQEIYYKLEELKKLKM